MKILILAAVLLPVTAFAADSRDFSLDVPAEDIDRLELESNVGEVSIEAADIDAIEVRVRLEPGEDDDWFGETEDLERRLEEAVLEHDVDGEALRLQLDYDDSGDADFEEHWEIRLPARLALEIDLNVGQLNIDGMSGGIEAEVNVGELDIEVLEGDIAAEVNVGELDIRSATESEGDFELESNIGEVRLTVDGKSAGRTEGWLGSTVVYSGGGDDDVDARVNVGEIRVEIR